MHISADVLSITLSASCMTISGGRTEQLDIFCLVTGFTSDFLSFIVVEHIRFFHGALQLAYMTWFETTFPDTCWSNVLYEMVAYRSCVWQQKWQHSCQTREAGQSGVIRRHLPRCRVCPQGQLRLHRTCRHRQRDLLSFQRVPRRPSVSCTWRRRPVFSTDPKCELSVGCYS